MAHDSTDPTRGFPQYAGTGAPADAADLSEIATWAGTNIDRVVATQAALATGFTPIYAGMRIAVTAIPGATFRYSGSAWVMEGIPVFASAAARDAAITSPNAGMLAFQTDLNALKTYNGTTWQYTQPLTPIHPSGTVTATGGAVTTSPGGLIVVTGACTELSIDGLFSSEFDDYEVHIKGTGSVANTINARLRAAGADISTGYSWGINDVTYAGVQTGSGASSDTSVQVGRIGAAAPSPSWSKLTIASPNLAAPKLFNFLGSSADRARNGGGYYATGTVCTGLSLLASTGNIQLQVRVFGITNVN